ncbi:hypothetical protein DICVIV_14205 [Dictyocaulus viviparus]|uniref:Uncharacterized protein n=1 Tax=Dictyocaulus viviparus TaxID=29172 RepID=A0A0D8X8C5_DICVI|nr:hypothetical protein DICVIV_14205 [Dictyocaulus viviparus]
MPKTGTTGVDPVSFTDTNAVTGAGTEKATGSAMMDLITGLQKNKGSSSSGDSMSSILQCLFKGYGFVLPP